MRSWKLAFVLALVSANLTAWNAMAFEPVALPKTMNDDAVTLKGVALYRKIHAVTERNLADIMSVPSDISSLATHRGRDFEYTPANRDNVVVSPVVLPSTLGRFDLVQVQPSLAGKSAKQHI